MKQITQKGNGAPKQLSHTWQHPHSPSFLWIAHDVCEHATFWFRFIRNSPHKQAFNPGSVSVTKPASRNSLL